MLPILEKFPLSKKLETARTKVDLVVQAATISPNSRLKADNIIDIISSDIESKWTLTKLTPLTPEDHFIVQMRVQDSIVEQASDLARKKYSNEPERAKHIENLLHKASAVNRVCNYAIGQANKNSYIAGPKAELSSEQKDAIERIFETKISDKEVLLSLGGQKAKSTAKAVNKIAASYQHNDNSTETIQAAQTHIQAAREEMIGRKLFAYAKDNNLNLYDVLTEVARKEKLKPALTLDEDLQKIKGRNVAAQVNKPLSMDDFVQMGLAVPATSLSTVQGNNKSTEMVPA